MARIHCLARARSLTVIKLGWSGIKILNINRWPARRIALEYIYAALLLHKLGKPVNEENLANVVKAAGVTPDEVKIKALASALSEVNIDEALKNAAAMAAAPVAGGQQQAAPAKAEEKPKEEEKKEEEALQGLASLFG